MKTKAKVESSQGNFTSEMFYEDYKKTDGIVNSHKNVMHRDGTLFLELKIEKISYNQKIDSSIFSMKK